MRIAMPIHAFEPGGVERVGLRLAECWAKDGAQVTVVLGRDRGACRDERPYLHYHKYKEPIPTQKWETIWMMWSLLRYLLKEEVDAIFCPGLTYTAPCVFAKLVLCLVPGKSCPKILVKISNDLDRKDMGGLKAPFYRLWLAIQGRVLDHFVAIGEPMRLPSARLLCASSARVSVIPDPALSRMDFDAFSKIERPQRKSKGRHFLAVGRLVPQKNFELLLEAFASFARTEDRLVIAGEGPCREQLAEKIDALNIAEQVSMLGHVSDTMPLYASASALVLSSRYEGVPAVVIEALAAGLPIASTDCCDSMGWLLGEGRFGELSRMDDSGDLARAMQQVAQRVLHPSAMRIFAQGFTLERSKSSYINLLSQLTMPNMERSKKIVELG